MSHVALIDMSQSCQKFNSWCEIMYKAKLVVGGATDTGRAPLLCRRATRRPWLPSTIDPTVPTPTQSGHCVCGWPLYCIITRKIGLVDGFR